MPLDTTLRDLEALTPEADRLLLAASGGELTGGPDNPPPREPMRRCQDIAHGSGGPWVAGSAGDLAVADDLPTAEVTHHLPYFLDERPWLRYAGAPDNFPALPNAFLIA